MGAGGAASTLSEISEGSWPDQPPCSDWHGFFSGEERELHEAYVKSLLRGFKAINVLFMVRNRGDRQHLSSVEVTCCGREGTVSLQDQHKQAVWHQR